MNVSNAIACSIPLNYKLYKLLKPILNVEVEPAISLRVPYLNRQQEWENRLKLMGLQPKPVSNPYSSCIVDIPAGVIVHFQMYCVGAAKGCVILKILKKHNKLINQLSNIRMTFSLAEVNIHKLLLEPQ